MPSPMANRGFADENLSGLSIRTEHAAGKGHGPSHPLRRNNHAASIDDRESPRKDTLATVMEHPESPTCLTITQSERTHERALITMPASSTAAAVSVHPSPRTAMS